jgi:hypothetical protein
MSNTVGVPIVSYMRYRTMLKTVSDSLTISKNRKWPTYDFQKTVSRPLTISKNRK